jgi:hypothetical protein
VTVSYEITATVAPELVAEYDRFMREHHIPALLATGHFRSAAFARSTAGRYRMRYEAWDQAELERYLASNAAALRAEFAARFPAGVELSRETWSVLETWSAERGGRGDT